MGASLLCSVQLSSIQFSSILFIGPTEGEGHRKLLIDQVSVRQQMPLFHYIYTYIVFRLARVENYLIEMSSD